MFLGFKLCEIVDRWHHVQKSATILQKIGFGLLFQRKTVVFHGRKNIFGGKLNEVKVRNKEMNIKSESS